MATPNKIEEVRSIFETKLKEGIPNPPGEFHPFDLERVKNDKYIKRVLIHKDDDPKPAAGMLWDILVWRKTVGANEINESNIRLDYVKEGIFFSHGRDIDGHKLLIIKLKLYNKGSKDFEELKKCLIYWFDRIEREEEGKAITFFFDMEGSGLSNMDMELIKYLIALVNLYYPAFLNYILIYQMPWVLNAAFKVVKSLLPAKGVERMKFLNKENVKTFVPLDQALACWGGTDNYIFEFVPENRSPDATPKKVTFAEQGDNANHSPGEMLRLIPNDIIHFKQENDEISGQFTITNMDESAISFKIRTTSPEKFRVRPSSGTLASGASQTVSIVVQPGFQLKTMIKDRFLVMSVQIPKNDLNQKDIAEIWQKSSGSKVDEYRLRCHFPDNDLSNNGNLIAEKNVEKTDPVTKALHNLQFSYESLHKEVKMLKLFQIVTLLLTAIAVFLSYFVYKSTNNGDKYCERM